KEEEHISEHLPEHFILLKSKDIVSGDFYWALEKQNHFYLAAVDCTGHGVPGAFMSMLGVAFLNEINATMEVLSPAEILNQLRDKIVKELGQGKKELEAKDGMDISLIRYNLKTQELQWAGANNPIYYIKNGQWFEIKANKQPISYQEKMTPFTNHIIQMESGSSFYLFTDGYADQFGGPAGKKFKYSQLKETLFAISHKPMKAQKIILRDTFDSWKGELEQIDDVCVIGMKV
ncbi:MAG TPA: SpoIIE family protein phosphatase, partial [Bacteroidia bacterium]|nr:SpoIIE family protein phosphatase [Bacteroidia bacterium]